ncbi:hypothetical protein [Kordiimonas aestuarii]|uniref:hypothetical protein n=1 Tax=Kordiimonas aestuarii TaxID=1005925 RepID=UPI0021D3D5CC|nr:hypothetical protein [Kordiimonas aestuarii]
MSDRFAAIFTTINAPYRLHMDEADLIRYLSGEEIPTYFIGQIWGFFGEVPVEEQLAFAECHGISARELKEKAQKFSIRSGAHFPILNAEI